MYAVFRSGGKQYRAEQGDVLRLEKIDAEEGASIEFAEVLLVGDGKDLKVGSPLVDGTSVSATVLRQGKSRKVPVVKFRRRQNYLRQGTHRQFFTEVEITSIGGQQEKKASGQPASKAAKPAEADTGNSADQKPVDKKSADQKSIDKKSAGSPSADKSAAASKKSAGKKASKKSAKKKTAGKKAAGKKAD